jgi:hypothetical protein
MPTIDRQRSRWGAYTVDFSRVGQEAGAAVSKHRPKNVAGIAPKTCAPRIWPHRSKPSAGGKISFAHYEAVSSVTGSRS